MTAMNRPLFIGVPGMPAGPEFLGRGQALERQFATVETEKCHSKPVEPDREQSLPLGGAIGHGGAKEGEGLVGPVPAKLPPALPVGQLDIYVSSQPHGYKV